MSVLLLSRVKRVLFIQLQHQALRQYIFFLRRPYFKAAPRPDDAPTRQVLKMDDVDDDSPSPTSLAPDAFDFDMIDVDTPHAFAPVTSSQQQGLPDSMMAASVVTTASGHVVTSSPEEESARSSPVVFQRNGSFEGSVETCL